MRRKEQALTARRRQRFLMGAIGVAVMLLLSVASLDSYRDLRVGSGQAAELSREIAASEMRIEALERRIERLSEDPAKLEQLAREELMMARPGEVVIILPGDSDPAKPQSEPGIFPDHQATSEESGEREGES